MVPEKPLMLVPVMVVLPEDPAGITMIAGLAEIEKSPAIVTVTETVCAIEPPVPVTLTW